MGTACAPPGKGRSFGEAGSRGSLPAAGVPSREGCTIERVRRLLTWAVVTVGIGALARRLKRRSEAAEKAPEPVEAAPDDDPADELRRKLAEARAEEAEPEPPSAEPASVDERRASVHAAGRSTLDEMHDTGEA
jgi:hypothetical protein